MGFITSYLPEGEAITLTAYLGYYYHHNHHHLFIFFKEDGLIVNSEFTISSIEHKNKAFCILINIVPPYLPPVQFEATTNDIDNIQA